MKILATDDAATILACADSALQGRHKTAFVCEDVDSNPTLIIFAEYWQRQQLDDLLRTAADELANALTV